MKDWKYKTFGEVVNVNPKVILDKKQFYDFVEMADVEPGRKFVYPSQKRLPGSGSKFQESDTLFARITPCLENGKISQVKELENGKGFGSTEFYVFRGKENETDNDFVYYLCLTDEVREPAIKSMVGASGRQRAQIDAIESLDIFLPPLPIQRKIASILCTYDDLIENNLKQIKLLCELAEIKFKRLIENGSNFSTCFLDELAEYLGRGVTPVYEEGSGFWAINQKANKGLYLETQHFKEYKLGNWVPSEKFAKNGDVIINSLGEGTIGRCHFYKWEDNKYPVDQHMSIFRGKTKEIALFVYQYLNSEQGQGKLYSLKKGGTNMTMLNIGDLRNLKVELPSEKVLSKYYSEVEPHFDLKAVLEIQNQRLKEARDILLPRLMTGMIEV